MPHERRRGIGLGRVLAALSAPSWEAPIWLTAAGDSGRPSAVLVLLFEEDGEARVVLTRRASHLRNHRGEVSFPGGRLEEGETPIDAALREASEEIGLEPTSVTVVGELTPLSTMSSAAAITPIVGTVPSRPAVHPNPDEVEHVFDVSLAELLDHEVYEEEVWDSPDRGRRPVYFFHLPDDTVWGATARVLHELLAQVALA
ncbi:MAG TPA: CoA pyrophosphatase [Acidimicrobiales bacterium]|nr:CoA pyrophosphatase [Acidimicrobiales bacterium]